MKKGVFILIFMMLAMLIDLFELVAQTDYNPFSVNQKEGLRTIKYNQVIAKPENIKENDSESTPLKFLDGTIDVTMEPGETKKYTKVHIGGIISEIFYFDTILEIPSFMSFHTDAVKVYTISGTCVDFTLIASDDAQPGEYAIRVEYSFHSGGQVTTKFMLTINLTITEPIEAPIADFTGSPREGEAPLAVHFTDQSTGEITDWDWDFGDGQNSTASDPTHTYQSAGTYTVSLTVTGPGGSDTKTRNNYITVTEPSPVADFIGTPTSGTKPLTVKFTDKSTGSITDWDWDFGDGQTSTASDPTHIYQSVGTYTVSLTVTGPGGSDTKTCNNYITVTEPNIVVSPDTLFFSVSGGSPGAYFSSVTELHSKRGGIADLSRVAPQDSPLKVKSLSVPTGDFSGDLDTLSNSFEPPYYRFKEQYQTKYEATKLVPASACTLMALFYGFWNYDITTNQRKNCEFYIWEDNNGRPGTNLWSTTGTISLAADEAAWIKLDVSEERLTLDGAFWIGHKEVTSGAPSSLVDTVETPGMNFYSNNGTSWSEDAYDYLQKAVVAYSGEVPKDEDVAMMTVYNTGNGVLEVSDISSRQSWVISIVPTSFSVSPDDSQEVSVRVSSSGIASGKYFGAIEINSNDTDTPEYNVPLVFDVGRTRFWADIDGDHDVDVVDIQIVAGKWNTKVGDPDYDPRCDVDNEGQGDGDIDVVDIQLVAGWWNKTIPPCSGNAMIAKTSEGFSDDLALKIDFPIQNNKKPGSYYVVVRIENAVNLGAFQFDIVSKNKELKIEEVNLGNFLQNTQNRFMALGPEMDLEKNRLTFGAYSYGESLGASGSGVLVRIGVSSENGDVTSIALENIKLVDSRGNLLPVKDTINTINDQARTEVTSQSFSLNQNYPNPFNSETVIKYHLPKGDKVTLKIYNLLGQQIKTLVNDQKQAGYFEIQWDGKDEFGTEVPSGVYVYRIKIGSYVESKKMFLLR